MMTNACTFEVIEEDDMATPINIRGWSKSGNLFTGHDPRATTPPSALSMQADLNQEDSVTTQFNLEADPGIITNTRAEIVSSVKGQSVRRLVTVVDGMSITTRGKSITVKVRDFTDPSLSDGQKYSVNILSTLGVRAGSKQPPILIPLTYFDPLGVETVINAAISIASGTTVTLDIPNDAGICMVHTTVWVDSAGVAIPAQSLFVSHENNTTVMKYYDPFSFPDWVPLAPNSNILRLSNSSGFIAYYQVTFGIDG